MSLDHSQPHTLEIAHVLFMDIVGYSRLPMDQQTQLLQQLNQIIRSTEEFRRAQAGDQLIRLPTGDGMALVFFGNPVAPVQCAMEVSCALRNQQAIKLRMGVHSGPVYRVVDINTNKNVAGGGINIAQRVMDCGDAGHILLSRSVADVLSQLSSWEECLHDLGEAEIKHGERVHVFNLYTSEVGNPEVPEKLRSKLVANNSVEITRLLLAWSDGDRAALERLLPLVIPELRLIAKRYMRQERSGHVLQTTALINEAFIKLVGQTQVHWQNRAHFFAIAAQCMRRILMDYARTQRRAKRGGGAQHLALTDAPVLSFTQSEELLTLDTALNKLAQTDERKSKVVELRYFGGCSDEEIAELLNVSVRTVARDWRLARSWLRREIGSQPHLTEEP